MEKEDWAKGDGRVKKDRLINIIVENIRGQ
jgi:hypothetical protein